MSSIKLESNASGTGIFTIASPNSNTNRTLTLPDNTGTVLTSATTTGFPAGSVIQVVQAIYSTLVTSSSTSFVDSGLSASITPTSASSKILILLNPVIGVYRQNNTVHGAFNLVRGSTQINSIGAPSINGAVGSGGFLVIDAPGSMVYLDSPATTSSTTYKMQMRVSTSADTGAVRLNNYPTAAGDSNSSITLMEIGA